MVDIQRCEARGIIVVMIVMEGRGYVSCSTYITTDLAHIMAVSG